MRIDINKILCATDLSDFSNDVVSYGVAMAKAFDAQLIVCHVIKLHAASLYAEASLDPLTFQKQQADAIKEQFGRLARQHGVRLTPLVLMGHPPDEIVRYAREHHIDLVVTATHGRSGIKRLLLGSVAERLMRMLPCPSLTVISRDRAAYSSEGPDFALNRIMVGCDFSPDSGLAVRYGLSFAQEFQAELHLVHVVESLADESARRGTLRLKERKDSRARLARQLTRLVPEDAGNWCVPVTNVVEGQAHEELVRYATLNRMDMILLGVRGHGLIETFLVGSTTDRVVRQSPCPVLSARPMSQIEVLPRSMDILRESETATHLDVDFELFSGERRDGVAVIRIKGGLMQLATDLRAKDTLLDYLQQVNAARDVRVAAVIGAPDKAGRDEYFEFYDRLLKAELDRNAIHRLFNAVDQIVLALVELPTLVVHADSGQVISIYCNLSLACDYRIVADNTVFQNPCLEMGMIPKGGGPFFLSQKLGSGKAYEVLLADRDITAGEALEMGFVDQVVPLAELEKSVMKVAKQFAQKPVTSLKGIKRLVNFTKKDLRAYLELENQELLSIIGSPHLPMGNVRQRPR